MSDAPLPEADRIAGAPHPRETAVLYGHGVAEAAFLDAYTSSKLHHAWLITGPRGVGKATLAWRIARFLLSHPYPGEDDTGGGLFGAPPTPQTLDADMAHPAVRRAQALGEPRLALVRRPWDDKAKRLRKEIPVDEVRRLKGFFALSAADGGGRVAIIDAADEMNQNAANALLKLLEEPPARTTLLLVSHQPARLLPTIRSRCRALRCAPLGAADQAAALAGAGVLDGADSPALAALSAGSVGDAVALLEGGGLDLYARLVGLMAQAPGMDRTAARALADACAGASNGPTYDLVLVLLDRLLARLARFGALQTPVWTEAAPHEARAFAALAPNPGRARRWADLAAEVGARTGHGRAVNIDPATVVLDALLAIDGAARGA